MTGAGDGMNTGFLGLGREVNVETVSFLGSVLFDAEGNVKTTSKIYIGAAKSYSIATISYTNVKPANLASS